LIKQHHFSTGQSAAGFTMPDILMRAEKYLHRSANGNRVVRNGQGMISAAVKPAKRVTFTNRPEALVANS